MRSLIIILYAIAYVVRSHAAVVAIRLARSLGASFEDVVVYPIDVRADDWQDAKAHAEYSLDDRSCVHCGRSAEVHAQLDQEALWDTDLCIGSRCEYRAPTLTFAQRLAAR